MMSKAVRNAGRKGVRSMATGKDVRFGAEVCKFRIFYRRSGIFFPLEFCPLCLVIPLKIG